MDYFYDLITPDFLKPYLPSLPRIQDWTDIIA